MLETQEVQMAVSSGLVSVPDDEWVALMVNDSSGGASITIVPQGNVHVDGDSEAGVAGKPTVGPTGHATKLDLTVERGETVLARSVSGTVDVAVWRQGASA